MKRLFLIALLSATFATRATALNYEKDIMPIMKAKCFKCHSEAERSTKGGIAFDNLTDMEEMYIGPYTTMVPGKPGDSGLLHMVNGCLLYTSPSPRDPE